MFAMAGKASFSDEAMRAVGPKLDLKRANAIAPPIRRAGRVGAVAGGHARDFGH